jgi:hypothetical protein
MGTKRNPGRYDCYAAAEPDEPMFVLLARDQYAPLLVREWARCRWLDGDREKAMEADECAKAMEEWQRDKSLRASGFVSKEARDIFLHWTNKTLDLDSDEFVELGPNLTDGIRAVLKAAANRRAELNAKKSKGE